MKSYLKVKVCTLAAESKAIKVQQRRWKRSARRARQRERDLAFGAGVDSMAKRHVAFARANFIGLQAHRLAKYGVRSESRDTNLAYGFLCNRPYARMEAFSYTKPNWENIEKMVRRFGQDDSAAPDTRDVMQRFSGWKHDAELHYLTATAAHSEKVASRVERPHVRGTRPDLDKTT